MRFKLLALLISAGCATLSPTAQADDDKVRTALGAAAYFGGWAAGSSRGNQLRGAELLSAERWR